MIFSLVSLEVLMSNGTQVSRTAAFVNDSTVEKDGYTVNRPFFEKNRRRGYGSKGKTPDTVKKRSSRKTPQA